MADVKYTKLYTRGGDGGKTSLFNGERIDKGSPLIGLLGKMDQLNHEMGGMHILSKEHSPEIKHLQNIMFKLMGDIAGGSFFSEDDTTWILNKVNEVATELNSSQNGWVVYGVDQTILSYMFDGLSIKTREVEHLYHSNALIEKTSFISTFLNALSKYFYLKARQCI